MQAPIITDDTNYEYFTVIFKQDIVGSNVPQRLAELLNVEFVGSLSNLGQVGLFRIPKPKDLDFGSGSLLGNITTRFRQLGEDGGGLDERDVSKNGDQLAIRSVIILESDTPRMLHKR